MADIRTNLTLTSPNASRETSSGLIGVVAVVALACAWVFSQHPIAVNGVLVGVAVGLIVSLILTLRRHATVFTAGVPQGTVAVLYAVAAILGSSVTIVLLSVVRLDGSTFWQVGGDIIRIQQRHRSEHGVLARATDDITELLQAHGFQVLDFLLVGLLTILACLYCAVFACGALVGWNVFLGFIFPGHTRVGGWLARGFLGLRITRTFPVLLILIVSLVALIGGPRWLDSNASINPSHPSVPATATP